MPDILHTFTVAAPAAQVYRALTEQAGLASWWTEQTTAENGLGARLIFDFGERYHNTMTVVDLLDAERVAWHIDEAHPEWVGTVITFDLEADGEVTRLRFGHRDWREATDFFASCNFQWGFYMQSLKSYCETGAGRPWLAENEILD
ncbi:SRPBCC domain-containing protein [bacterium]|nr:SRPBCC domain-containing protein [bacterium]